MEAIHQESGRVTAVVTVPEPTATYTRAAAVPTLDTETKVDTAHVLNTDMLFAQRTPIAATATVVNGINPTKRINLYVFSSITRL